MSRNIIPLVISTTVLILIAAGFALSLAVLSILIGILGAQRGQRAIYYAIRREAQQKASQRYVFAFWCVLLAVVLFAVSRILPGDGIADEATVLPTAAPIVTVTALELNPTVQAAARATAPIFTSTVDSIATPALSTSEVTSPAAVLPTPTLAAAIAETVTQVAPQAAPAPTEALTITAVPVSTAQAPAEPATIVIAPNQQLALRAIGTGWDASGALQGVSTEFPVGTKIIYVFFNFLDVPRGTLLRHTWLQDGKAVSFSSVTFNKVGRGTEAISWVPKDGFQPGLYEVRVALGDTPQFVANFLVR